jgi:hypothetical protein
MLWPSVLGFLYQRFSLLVCNEACQFMNQSKKLPTAVFMNNSSVEDIIIPEKRSMI